ncbi:hypothetical protein [Actinoplanes awajinensis]|uniref:hypothetical protein n=1 Tax=Actinoplanes awajinensis TaxID=135946 RepID=UPI000A82F31C|nr:hypothetical protein [Actinoplanes awajinensis]
MIDEFPEPSTILQAVDWSGLENADGCAYPETPAKLADLVATDPGAVQGALDHLDNALLNDGVVYSATAPAVRYVAALLGDPRSRKLLAPDWEKGKYPLRGKLLTWLSNVAYDVSMQSERRIRSWAGYAPTVPFPRFLEIRKLYPLIFPSVDAYLKDPDPKVREAALIAAVQLLESSDLVSQRQLFVPLARNFLAASSDKWLRGIAIEALATWGENVDSLRSVVDSERVGDDLPNSDWDSSEGPVDDPPF